ncbi:MAG: hypothetical protein ACOX7C_10930 [Brevefilum sp.]|jgi:hypothetical protein
MLTSFSIMKKRLSFITQLFLIILVSCSSKTPNVSVGEALQRPFAPTSSFDEQSVLSLPEKTITTEAPEPFFPQSTTIPTPDNLASLYGCETIITFTSGPLKNQISKFTVLDRDYFEDKGDKFALGKGTAVFYEKTPYLILHSSFLNGNILKPMEAEFIRKYLEHWGKKDNDYIQQQIDQLIGSEIEWLCNGEYLLTTKINSIARLSHQASEKLWLEPEEIENILIERKGDRSEWVGTMKPSFENFIYLGFCGWGPESLDAGRYTYYRYVIRMTIQDT